jgi:uncharacterized protein (TIGR03435 family)
MAGKNLIQSVSPARNRLRGAGKIATFAAFLFLGLSYRSLPAQNAPDITGNWQGTLQMGGGQRVVVKISKADAGWQGVLYRIDSGQASMVPSIVLQGAMLKFAIPAIAATYLGKVSADGTSIAGMFTQGSGSFALNLVRAAGDAAWAIPEPDKLMARDADPAFEVATIKESKPDDRVDGYGADARHVWVENHTVNEMIEIAYGIHRTQIEGGPSWLDEQHYDIDGIADVAGKPNKMQIRAMIQKLLADRYQLTTHHEKKELSVYAITVGKSGARLTKSLGDPNGLSDERGHGGSTGLEVQYTNFSMADLAENLQTIGNEEQGRPVVDLTGLAGRFDFKLKWWPDAWRNPGPDAAPALSTALQEQLGLKLEATKAMVDVIMIDHVDRPSPN